MTPREQLITELRSMVNWLETCPDSIPIPNSVWLQSVTTIKETPINDILHLPGKKRKEPGTYYFCVAWKFGQRITYTIAFAREDVCEKRVLRTYEVPAHTVEAHTEEEVEWICPPSLLKENQE